MICFSICSGFPGGSEGKESACLGLIPGPGRSPGKGNGYLLQYSCLENSMDRSLVGYSPQGHRKVGHGWVTNTFTFTFSYLFNNYSVCFYSILYFCHVSSTHFLLCLHIRHFVFLMSCLSGYSVQFSSVAQSCPTLCDPVERSPPDSSVHRFFQTRILEQVAIPFSRASFWARNRTWVSYIARRF